ncbi:uncharacterized protein BDW43DRAFT_316247 [Aspergillus alliaceus]|uniref:uncharacterized protein n=1 Tax=Petromyces alliaceus TaxID=209559 RepID=UPI0012A3D9C4|nr:uncharacterized protein BDW43DRAFT_316247 [Aspergillus alliaceus]KAB8228040.1 hypothetical protein BDW43DRAFT_316247 [Aspergillus alliaceus]
MVNTQGSTPGAVLVKLNLKVTTRVWYVGYPCPQWQLRRLSALGRAMPDVRCPSAQCQATHTTGHVTSRAVKVYLGNVWIWTAEHVLNDPSDMQILIYIGPS